MTTIGVITTCHTYERFLPDWARSVAALERQPDKIVIAATSPANVVTAIADHLNPGTDFVVTKAPSPWNFSDSLNAAVERCDTDWIVWIGCDDTYLPHALTGWEDNPADMIGFGLEFMDKRYARYVRKPSPEDVLTMKGNLIPCGSPFRRSVWERTPFQRQLSPLEDWAFSVGAAATGCTFDTTNRIDFLYRTHEDQIRPDEAPVAKKIQAWRDELLNV